MATRNSIFVEAPFYRPNFPNLVMRVRIGIQDYSGGAAVLQQRFTAARNGVHNYLNAHREDTIDQLVSGLLALSLPSPWGNVLDVTIREPDSDVGLESDQLP